MKLLAIDIGGTFLKYAVMDEAFRQYEKGKIPTPQSGREALIEAIGTLFDKYNAAEKAPSDRHDAAEKAPSDRHDAAKKTPSDKCAVPEGILEGIAVSMPGIIDAENGYVAMGGAIQYNNDFYLRDALRQRCPSARITLCNDAKCAAQAEASAGALKDVKDGVVLLFGTMIGGGIVIDHKVRQGIHYSAGEVSYILSDRACDPEYDTVWGNRCGTPALCRLFAEQSGIDVEEVDGVRVFEAVNAGDPNGIAALTAYTKNIAVQIFNLQTVLDMERFAIGGGISAQPVFIEYIRRHLERMYANSPYFVPQAEVVACRYGNDANLIGALQIYLNEAM